MNIIRLNMKYTTMLYLLFCFEEAGMKALNNSQEQKEPKIVIILKATNHGAPFL